MDLNDYFDPISLERPDLEFLEGQASFSHHISVHTPDQPIRELDQHQVVIFGIPEDRNAMVKGSAAAPDAVRSHLYRLAGINQKLKIYDLGNLKIGSSVNDSYFALRDILLELENRSIVALILGGSQDLCKGAFLALEKREELQHVVSVDSMLDFTTRAEAKLNSRSYLNHMFEKEAARHFSYTNLGQQAYFMGNDQLRQMDQHHFEAVRLGKARADLRQAEPPIRDAVLLSIDLGAVRQSDAPAASIPSPNGFTGEELCQLTRYAGLSDRTTIVAFFELNPERDLNGQTAHLTAQAAWYFLDGFTFRNPENPAVASAQDSLSGGFTSFLVNLDAAGHNINFLKSNTSGRWWMEIPVKNHASGHNFFIACSYEDYQQASKDEIPERWWRYLHILEKVGD